MDSTELAEYLTEVDADTPYYEMLICFDDDRAPWWACNRCGTEIDPSAGGCPEHAPRDIPGLVRADCEADPPHPPAWIVNGDHAGYGVPCGRCQYAELNERYRKATKTDRCYHWPWRRWTLTHKVAGWLYVLGISSGHGWSWGDGHDHCATPAFKVRGSRPYVLGVSREVWRCWFRGHRRGEEVGFGFCGKCVPWTCCGSQTVEHVDGCAEDVEQVRGTSAVTA